jgi:hypothetical protein
VDPLGEMRSWLSLYNYCQDNPTNKTDPNGALDDDIRVDTKTKEVTVNPTNDSKDRIFIDGQYSGEREKGTSLEILEAKGYNVKQGPRIEGVGMGATDKGMAFVYGATQYKILWDLINNFNTLKTDSKLGDLTPEETNQIQTTVDKAGRPIDVGGSAANGTRRNVGTDLPIGKGEGTKSDIDYFAPPEFSKVF